MHLYFEKQLKFILAMSQKLQSFRKYLTKSKQIKQNWQRIENFSLSFDYYIQNLIREDQSGS